MRTAKERSEKMEKILIETYADLIRQGVLFFSGGYHFDCGADACTIKYRDRFGMFLDSSRIKTVRQEKEAVVHEWAHITNNATYGIDAPPSVRQKAEETAHRAEIKKLLPFKELRGVIRRGVFQVCELAEYFTVSEDLVRQAIEYYTGPCGLTF